MKKLDLTSYSITVKDQQGIARFIEYEVKEILVQVLTHRQFGFNGPDIMEKKPLIDKIREAGQEVILTNEEYQVILRTLKDFKGFIENDMKMLERIYNCPDNPDDGSNVSKFSKN